MNPEEILQSESGKQLISRLSENIVSKYKTDTAAIQLLIYNAFQGNKEILKLIEQKTTIKKIEKSRVYKDIQTTLKKKIYYQLRQYKRSEIDAGKILKKLEQESTDISFEVLQQNYLYPLAGTHVSTAERMKDLDLFYKKIFELTGAISSIIDLGCGIQPLTLPLEKEASSLTKYLALDKDPYSINLLKKVTKFFPDTFDFEARQWNITEGWQAVLTGFEFQFDLALMLKVVPVVKRQAPELLEVLCSAPAKQFLVSGSRIAMTKKENIEKRERKIVEHFIRESGKEIEAAFVIEEEFFYLVA